MKRSSSEALGPPVPQVCQRCRRVFPGDPSLLASAMIEWWACPPCRSVLGLRVSTVTPRLAEPTCWYGVPAHRPTMGRCSPLFNGAPVASEIFSGDGRRFYCEAHWHWRRHDAPRAHMRRL
jgi:hypothetical protein